MRAASSSHTGYLAIVIAGLLMCLGVQFETKRQYLVAWQNHLASQQNRSKENSKRVKAFFSTLNDNLGTIGALPSVRRTGENVPNFGADDHETVQQVYNNLAKNIDVSKVYVFPADFGSTTSFATNSKPALMFDRLVMPMKNREQGSIPPPSEITDTLSDFQNSEFEHQQLRKHIKWFQKNYPEIGTLKTFSVPMISGTEILTSDDAKSIKMEQHPSNSGLVFSVPYFGSNGKIAGCVSAVILSSVLRNITNDTGYTLISPLADYMSAPTVRNSKIAMMLHAADHTPEASTIFSEAIIIDTHDVRGTWQLNIKYPVIDYYSGPQYKAIRFFEWGSYAALALLTFAGLGWHHSNLRRAQEMRENADALRRVNVNISKLNTDLAENMKQLHVAQDEIIKKGKLAQMGQLVATVAHELRNPLSSVRTSAFLLRRKLVDQPVSVDAQLQRIDNSVARCDAVITQFLDYAKSHKMEFSEAEFDDWVASIVEEEAQKLPSAVAVECILGLDNLSVSFDRSRLSRVLINLMSNASEAMVGKGHDPQKFATSNPKITIVTRLAGEHIEFDVCDNGPGIADEDVAKILEPLFTTKNFGTGLGLPAVVQVLEQHGGGIRVKGGFGTGAIFTAWLPIKIRKTRAV